jgi:hypothetical protein
MLSAEGVCEAWLSRLLLPSMLGCELSRSRVSERVPAAIGGVSVMTDEVKGVAKRAGDLADCGCVAG